MKPENFSCALGDIREDFLQESEQYRKHHNHRSRWWAVAAVLALVLTVSCFGIHAEAVRYRQAVAFFEKNGLSTENLSRTQIIRIYQDISTNQFEYNKTADLVIKTATQRIDGFQVDDQYTPETLKSLWEISEAMRIISLENTQPGAGIFYEFETVYEDEQLENYHCLVRKYDNGALLWETSISHCHGYRSNAIIQNEYVLIYDYDYGSSSPCHLVLIDPKGNILFRQNVTRGANLETIHTAALTDDSVLVITRITNNENRIGFYKFDYTGKLLSYADSVVEYTSFGSITAISDGYLVTAVDMGRLSNNRGHSSTILRLDIDGNLLTAMEYTSNEFKYDIRDMMEFEGNIYLSVHQSPASQSFFGSSDSVYQTVLEQMTDFSPGADLATPTALIRDYYDAALLVCNADTLEIEGFYTVEGALGNQLRISKKGELEWDVGRISTIYLSMATSSFTFAGLCDQYLYTFDADGILVDFSDTGNNVIFRQ